MTDKVTKEIPTNSPVPAPRSKRQVPSKPPPIKKHVANSCSNSAKPDVPTKPKLLPKPLITGQTSPSTILQGDKQQDVVSPKRRPHSVKITDDSIHNKVAGELTLILGRPRSSSKGLLSPTSYSTPDSSSKNAHLDASTATSDSSTSVSPLRNTPTRPVPRPRQSLSLVDGISPTSPPASPTSPPASTTSPPASTTSPPASTVSTVPHTQSQAAPENGTKEKKPRPSRPPPPSRSLPPKEPPSAQLSTQDNTSGDVNPADKDITTSPASQRIPENKDTKKKLEITVLGARPMSEVGFREVKSQSVTSQPTKGEVVSVEKVKRQVGQVKPPLSLSTQQVSSGTKADSVNKVIKTLSDDTLTQAAHRSMADGKPSVGAATRKPTIIRPGRRSNNNHSDTDRLVSKAGASMSTSPKTMGNDTRPQTETMGNDTRSQTMSNPINSSVSVKNEPPNSLPVKKDPWNQIAKGPGPTDNLAFSTGDTPPSKSQGLTLLSTVAHRQEESPKVEGNGTLIDLDGKLTAHSTNESSPPKCTKTIMDQSLECTGSDVLLPTPNTSPETESNMAESKAAEPTMFFHNQSTRKTDTSSKPSALQRIYQAKQAREEKQPEKYKHRADCYVDKPNIDVGFWKPTAHSSDSEPSSRDDKVDDSEKGSNNAATVNKEPSIVAFAAFDYNSTESADLPLRAGQEVKVTAKLNSEWLYGESGAKSGTFPALYVSVSQDDIDMLPIHRADNADSFSNKSTHVAGTALYDFTAEHDSELSLKAGEMVADVETVDAEWSIGRIGKTTGIFPTSFIELNESKT